MAGRACYALTCFSGLDLSNVSNAVLFSTNNSVSRTAYTDLECNDSVSSDSEKTRQSVD